jgi:hypothetical protein
MSIDASLAVSVDESADVMAERRLVHRVFVWMAIVVPLAAGFSALLVFVSAHMAGVPAGAPTAMGAGIGVLTGVFFGMWAGVVASVGDIEHVEYTKVDSDDVSDDHR